MAAIIIPVKIDGFKCVEDIAQAVLNYTYKGKTLKEWADSISKPKTNADRIRAMTDEELAKLFNGTHGDFLPTGEPLTVSGGYSRWLDWLKQEAKE